LTNRPFGDSVPSSADGLTSTPSELLPGTLELLILKTLVSGAKHGYGIVEHLRLTSDDVLRVGESALYPALAVALQRLGEGRMGYV